MYTKSSITTFMKSYKIFTFGWFKLLSPTLSNMSSADVPLITIPHDCSSIKVNAKYIIPVEDMEKKLANLNIYKTIGPSNFPNSILRDLCGIVP